MKINRSTEWQMTDKIGEYILLEQDSYKHEGAVSQCFGGRSKTESTTTTTQDIETTQFGQESITGIGLQAGGDIEFTQEVTDLGAVQGAFDVVGGAFDFTGEFAQDAFDFANTSQRQASELAQRSIDTSQKAVATVATGGAVDLAGVNAKTIAIIAAAAAAIFIIPQIVRRAS